jgi:hypothetical protein
VVTFFELDCYLVSQYINGTTNQSDGEAIAIFRQALTLVPLILFCDISPTALIKSDDNREHAENSGISQILAGDLPREYKLIMNSIKSRAGKVPLYRLFETFVKVARPTVEKIPSMTRLVIYHFLQICPATIQGVGGLWSYEFNDVLKHDTMEWSAIWKDWTRLMDILLRRHVDDCSIRNIVKGYKNISESFTALNDLFNAYKIYCGSSAGFDSSIGLHSFLPPYLDATKKLVDIGEMSFFDRYMCLLHFISKPCRFILLCDLPELGLYLSRHIGYNSPEEGGLVVDIETEGYFEATCNKCVEIHRKHDINPRKWIEIRKEIKLGKLGCFIPLDEAEVDGDTPGDFDDVVGTAELPMSSLECIFCDAPDHTMNQCASLRDFENAEIAYLDMDILSVRDPSFESLVELPYSLDAPSVLEDGAFRSLIKRNWDILEGDI